MMSWDLKYLVTYRYSILVTLLFTKVSLQEITSRLSFQKLMAAPVQYCIMGVVLNANWTTYLQSPVVVSPQVSCIAFSDTDIVACVLV